MACGAKGKCNQAYRKPGKNTVHCLIQTRNGGKWDFCAHQYYCGQKDQYELSKEADNCLLPPKTERKMVSEAQEAIEEAKTVFADEIQPKIQVLKSESAATKRPRKQKAQDKTE